jgi:hypothetical protein
MDPETNNRGKTPAEIQREDLGIPDSLRNGPVLFVSSHRGLLETKYPSHMTEFKRVMQGENEDGGDDEEQAYLDLATAPPDQVVDILKTAVLRDDPSRSGKWLSSDTNTNEPPPRSTTFEVDPNNAREILPQLKEFLEDKGVLNEKPDQKQLKP